MNNQSLIMFDKFLSSKAIDQICLLDEKMMKKMLSSCGQELQTQTQKDKERAYVFFANYNKLLKRYAKVVRDEHSNNLSLHFALLLSHFMLKQESIQSAKVILKQTENFIDSAHPDPMLLSISFNNLAFLYLKGEKYAKAALTSLKVIGVMSQHLKNMKTRKMPKSKIADDAIVLISLLSIAQKSLQKLIDKYGKSSLKNIFKMINDVGFAYSNKYLGQKSYLTKKFIIPDDSIYLPVFIQEESVKKNENKKLLKNLDKIYTILMNFKNQPIIIMKEPQPQPKPVQIIIEDIPQNLVHFAETFKISDWHMQVKISKDLSISPSINQPKLLEYLNRTRFLSYKLGKKVCQFIEKQKMNKIVNVLSVTDVMPYEFQLKYLTAKIFLSKVLIKFIEINENGQVMISPRARSLIQPFLTKFCQEDAIILLAHVRYNQYRLAICQATSSDQIYLDIEVKENSFHQLVQVEEMDNDLTAKICFHLYYNQLKNKIKNKIPNSYVKVKNPTELMKRIVQILADFEQFLKQEEQSTDLTLSSLIESFKCYNFYKYVQLTENTGRYYNLKYRQNLNAFEVFVRNNSESCCPSGMTKAKGNSMYYPTSFSKDFGIPVLSIIKFLGAFCQILYQKYQIKAFSQPILEEEEEVLYSQNALTQLMIVSKFFKRKLLKYQNYYIPVTMEIVSINNQIPVGIRIIAYDGVNYKFMGHFIYAFPKDWEIPKEAIQIKKPDENISQTYPQIKTCVEDYNFKSGYFLARWMEAEGFQKIFNKIRIVNQALEIDGMSGKYSRIQQILPVM